VTREFTALGSKVVESNVAFKGPEDDQDFWEGEKFEGEHNQCLGPGSCLTALTPGLWGVQQDHLDMQVLCSSMPLDVSQHGVFMSMRWRKLEVVQGHGCSKCTQKRVAVMHLLLAVQLLARHWRTTSYQG
jgi:hypothetical protein